MSLVFLFFIAPNLSYSQDLKGAETFVRSLYQGKVGEKAVYSDRLDPLWKNCKDQARKKKETCFGDSILVDGQDSDIKNLKIQLVEEKTPQNVVIKATLTNFGIPDSVNFDLIFEGGRWKIDEIFRKSRECFSLKFFLTESPNVNCPKISTENPNDIKEALRIVDLIYDNERDLHAVYASELKSKYKKADLKYAFYSRRIINLWKKCDLDREKLVKENGGGYPGIGPCFDGSYFTPSQDPQIENLVLKVMGKTPNKLFISATFDNNKTPDKVHIELIPEDGLWKVNDGYRKSRTCGTLYLLLKNRESAECQP